MSPYIIAEVGQNHQGNVDLAVEYVQKFSNAGADAIKFQVRNNRELFSEQKYNSIYNSTNAFADTYGAHREFLELNPSEIEAVKNECLKCKVDFMATAFDQYSLELLLEIGVDVLKVASFDLGNLKLLDKFSKAQKPVVLSTGGGNLEHLSHSIELMLKHTDDIAILHCVSEYPCPAERLGLDRISELIRIYPNLTIGLSDHFSGTLSGPIGYMKGARVFEKHVTFNRAWKGTDHAFALELKGFSDFVRDIRRVPKMMQVKAAEETGTEFVFTKLGKSLILDAPIKKGDRFNLNHLGGIVSDNLGIPVREAHNFLGKICKHDLEVGAFLKFDDLVIEVD